MKRTGNHKVAVVGWGRGMGHSGHMYLADAVITQAKDMNADPYFFISKTVGKDDPIYPEEKVRIYQRVFPTYANIFSPQGNLNQALTDLSQMGYDGVVVVVGADQKQAFQYLEKPNKEGVPVYQTMGFKKLRVISRQETRSKYAQEEGPRATPMREILMNPTANENAKFKVWRRDMPKALNDQEVLDLMHKAEERMKGMAAKTKKLKEFVTKVRPLLKEASAAQKLKVLKLIKESMVNEYAQLPPSDSLEPEGDGREERLIHMILALLNHKHSQVFTLYGMGEVEDTVVDLVANGALDGLPLRDSIPVVLNALNEMYGNGLGEEEVEEGFSDIVKGIKRKVAGKEDPKEVEHMYGRMARSAIKHKTPDQAEKDIERYKKVAKVVNKEGSLNEFAPGNGDDGLPYAEYVVYQCDPNDQFEFIGGPLYQTDNLGMAHKYAYEHYLRYRPKAFVVYQPHKEASRGNYGVKGESDEEVAEGAPIVVMPRADRLKKPESTKVRYQGDIVPPTQPPSTEKRGVKGRPGQRPMTDQGVAEGWKDKVGAAALAGTMALGGHADAGQIGSAVAQGLGQGMTSAAVSSVADKKRNARDTEFAKQIPDEADRAIYLKALKRVKYSRALRFSDPSMMGANAVTEIKFKKLKQEMAEKYNITTPVKDEGVEETKSKAIARTAKDLKNPPKVMQHRAKRDQERDKELEYRNIAKRTDEDYLDEK